MFSLEERERAVELYFTTPMTTAQVVEHPGYPTRQCLERWLAMDSRYAGHMASIPGIHRQPTLQTLPGRITRMLHHLGRRHRRGEIQLHRTLSFLKTEHTKIFPFGLQENVRSPLSKKLLVFFGNNDGSNTSKYSAQCHVPSSRPWNHIVPPSTLMTGSRETN